MSTLKETISQIDVKRGPISSADELLVATLASDGVLRLPVDVEKLAEMIGLAVEYVDLPAGTDGELAKTALASEDMSGFTAKIDRSAPTHRQRFTLAHEIGHFIWHYNDEPTEDFPVIVERRNVVSSNMTNEKEVWANTFASEILIPSSVVIKMWGTGASVQELTRRFNVSTRVMGTWLDNLGLDEPDE